MGALVGLGMYARGAIGTFRMEFEMHMRSHTIMRAVLGALMVAILAVIPATAATDTQIREAQNYRQNFGLDASMATIEASWSDKEKYSDMSRGIPLTPAEAAEMDRRRDIVWAIGPVVDAASERDGYAEMHLDHARGGIPVFFFTEDIPAHRAAIEVIMPDGIGFDVQKVTFTLKQLRSKQERITEDMLESEWVLDGDIPIAQVAYSATDNRVLVGLEREGDDARARAILHDRYGPMVDVEFIGPSQED